MEISLIVLERGRLIWTDPRMVQADSKEISRDFTDVPLRVNGRISGTINGVEFLARDLQCYVQTKDGRTYTALSRVPEEIGASFQLLGNLGGVIGWLFAKPIGETKNGYELTGRESWRRWRSLIG